MKIKYPKSYHFHFSEKISKKGDRKHINDNHFNDKKIVALIKMDGENTTCTNEYSHARSLDSLIDSEDRRWIDTLRQFKIVGNIPDTYRIIGENLFYRHTCKYENLKNLFQVFSIFDNEICLDWDTVVETSKRLGLTTVPEFYRGVYDKNIIMEEFNKYVKNSKDDVEGFVIRSFDSFEEKEFKWNLSKFVRKSFKIGNSHWRHEKKIINILETGDNPWDFK